VTRAWATLRNALAAVADAVTGAGRRRDGARRVALYAEQMVFFSEVQALSDLRRAYESQTEFDSAHRRVVQSLDEAEARHKARVAEIERKYQR
jgi:hypothetical protein